MQQANSVYILHLCLFHGFHQQSREKFLSYHSLIFSIMYLQINIQTKCKSLIFFLSTHELCSSIEDKILITGISNVQENAISVSLKSKTKAYEQIYPQYNIVHYSRDCTTISYPQYNTVLYSMDCTTNHYCPIVQHRIPQYGLGTISYSQYNAVHHSMDCTTNHYCPTVQHSIPQYGLGTISYSQYNAVHHSMDCTTNHYCPTVQHSIPQYGLGTISYSQYNAI